MSNVYFISDGTYVKIGKSNNVINRLSLLNTGNAATLTLLGYILQESEEAAFKLEKELHKLYEKSKVKGEWFNLSEIDTLNLQTNYGMICTDHTLLLDGFLKVFIPLNGMVILIGTGRNLMKRKHKLKPIDLLSEMANMTSNESFAFITLRDSLNWDTLTKQYSLTIIPNQSEFTTYQQKQFKLGVKSLIDKDLVKRIKRGSYMINPMAIIPSNFEEAEKLWLELSNGN